VNDYRRQITLDKIAKLVQLIKSNMLPTIKVGKLFVPVISTHYGRIALNMGTGNAGTFLVEIDHPQYREVFPYTTIRQRATSVYSLHNITRPPRRGHPNSGCFGPLEWNEFAGVMAHRNYTSTYMFVPNEIKLTRQQREYDYTYNYWGDISNFDAYADKLVTAEEEAWKKALPKKPPPEDPTQSPPL
jgi:hypothetical protein